MSNGEKRKISDLNPDPSITLPNLKRLSLEELWKVELEVFECLCGFHIGLDATYLDLVGNVEIRCPACESTIRTDGFNEKDEKLNGKKEKTYEGNPIY